MATPEMQEACSRSSLLELNAGASSAQLGCESMDLNADAFLAFSSAQVAKSLWSPQTTCRYPVPMGIFPLESGFPAGSRRLLVCWHMLPSRGCSREVPAAIWGPLGWKSHLGSSSLPFPQHCRAHHEPMSPGATATWLWNAFRDRDSPTALGSLSRSLTTLPVRNFP